MSNGRQRSTTLGVSDDGWLRDFRAGPANTASDEVHQCELIEAGVNLLLVAELANIQMVEVAAEAGVGISTMYRLFPSKEVFFTHVLQRWVERFPDENRIPPEPDASNAERTYDLLASIVCCFENAPHIYRAFCELQSSDNPAVRAYWVEMSQTARAVFRGVLVDLDEHTAEMVSRLIAAALGAELRQWIFGRKTIEQVYADLRSSVSIIFGFVDTVDVRG